MNKLFNVKMLVLGSTTIEGLKRKVKELEINIWARDQVDAVKLFICRLVEDGYTQEDLIFISCEKL